MLCLAGVALCIAYPGAPLGPRRGPASRLGFFLGNRPFEIPAYDPASLLVMGAGILLAAKLAISFFDEGLTTIPCTKPQSKAGQAPMGHTRTVRDGAVARSVQGFLGIAQVRNRGGLKTPRREFFFNTRAADCGLDGDQAVTGG
jgi:hypothetical protein